MKIQNTVLRRIAVCLATLGLVLAPSGGGADDTAIFTTAVPPNVLLMVDNSGSMNEIMVHPNFKVFDANGVDNILGNADDDNPAEWCSLFGWVAPNSGGAAGRTAGSGNLADQNGKTTPYTCDSASEYCRFQLTGSESGFVGSTVTCPAGSPAATAKQGYITRKYCGQTRKMYIDSDTGCKANSTWYSEEYAEWYFGTKSNAYHGGLAEPNTNTNPLLVDADANGTHYIFGTSFGLFKRSRITAAKEIARDVIYKINTICPQGGGVACASDPTKQKNAVRFGIARFDDNAHGGFVSAPVDDYITNRASLESAVGALDAQTSTPLAETLFKLYTYFMPRTLAQLPKGKDGTTAFPKYQYSVTNGANTGSPPADPLKCPGSNAPCTCQKNFVILVTDGEPTNDNFATDGASAATTHTAGFSQFVVNLVGDYAPAGPPRGGDELEVGYPASGNGSKYLDDLALYMHKNDFRPDLTGTQTMDVYTVGFATGTNPVATSLLQRAAANGNGLYFEGTQSQQLTDALTSSINDIIQKSQSFTAATVPASRTAEGGNFYITEFVPSNIDPFWQGHLVNYEITADGKILDSTGACAVDDASGNCASGAIKSTASPFWDAATAMPLPAARTAFVSVQPATPTTGAANVINRFDTTDMTAAKLGLGAVFPPTPSYPGSDAATSGGATAATKLEFTADEIVQYVRGCTFATGVAAGDPCVPRTFRLGDIFHSNPVVVGKPSSIAGDASYDAFRTTWATRDRMIWAGANDGFVHAFYAGTWQPAAVPPGYDRGTGAERYAFMPWSARQNIKNLPVDTGARDFYFVDGSPKVADVWFNPTPTSVSKAANGSEWHTLLVGGMRQGGRQYYALDVTDPTALGASSYKWEFPKELDAAAIQSTMGETWGNPVMTRVKVAASPTDDNGGLGYERWVVVVSAGYDPKGDPNSGSYDGTNTATTSKAGRALYILDAQTGAVLAEKKFDYAAALGTPTREMQYAIASTPAVYDTDYDGYADLIYVGDLGGNIWKWVIKGVGHDTNSDGKVDDWNFRKFFEAPKYPNASAPTRWKSFFFAPGATLKDQTLWLAIGSGERADLRYPGISDAIDPTELENNRFYAITDIDPFENQVPALAKVLESNLTDVSDSALCTPITNRGFFFKAGHGDFNGDGVDDEGEKFVTNSAVFAFYVFISSFTPTISTDPCASGGTATLYVFRIFCGEPFFSTGASATEKRRLNLGTGMPTDPRISISAGDSGGTGPCSGGSANKVFIITSDNKVNNECMPPTPGGGMGVFYWRESP